jgi:hypothetical protein
MTRLYRYIFLSLWIASGIEAQERFVNTGQLYVADSLIIDGDFQAEGNSEVFQVGRTILTGNFLNNVMAGHVFTTDAARNKGSFEFRGMDNQLIAGTAPKERYINFPDTIYINNQGTSELHNQVRIQSGQAATTAWVDIRQGRLVLDSDPQGATASVHAHLLIKNDVLTRPNNIQVNLALGDNYQSGRLAGFTPPFEKLYADYFLFNFLSRPTARGLFGDEGRLITDPRTLLKPGLGYIIGMGIATPGYYLHELDPRWKDADSTQRATTKFAFSRAVAEPSFDKYLDDQSAPGYITGEKLVLRDVSLPIERGFNYLGNPYTTPLDLSDITTGNTSAHWGAPDNTLKKGFYVLSQGKGSLANAKMTFTASYFIRQQDGQASTYTADIVAPMQMFIVGSETKIGGGFKIPAAKRVHDSGVAFLRSAPYEITDELLIETTDTESQGYDRLCIAFRHQATLSASDPLDAVKIFNRSGGVNQIYSRSSDDQDLTVSVVPPATEKLPLYFSPSLLPQQVTLKADRLESLVSVRYVFLEDTKTQTLTDLMRTPSYTFASSPSDKPDRFVLHFTSSPATATEGVGLAPGRAMYADGILRIFGLRESDRGSDVSIFNMQGQLMHRQPLRETSPCIVNRRLPRGVYMVKNNDIVIKFAVAH